jgi:hypothetical protein
MPRCHRQEADDIQELSAEGRFLRLQDCGLSTTGPHAASPLLAKLGATSRQ